MKTILIATFLFVLAVNAAPDNKEKFGEIMGECVTETGVDKTQMEKFKNRDFTEATHDFMCFVDCFAKKSGFSVDGEIQVDTIKETFSKFPSFNEEKFNKAMSECKSVTGADECEKAFNFLVCHQKILRE